MEKIINYFMVRAISAFILGAILLCFPKNAVLFVVTAIGVLFIVPGLISLINYFATAREERSDIPFRLAGIGSILFGVLLVSVPNFFVNILMYLLGTLLLLGGISQIATLIRVRKITTVAVPFYVIPLLIVVAGFLVLFNPFKTAETIFTLIGVTCLFYGIMEFIYRFKFKNKLKTTLSET